MRNIRLIILFIGVSLLLSFQSLFSQNFIHPGGLVTMSDIERIQRLIDENDPTIVAAFNKLKNNGHAQSTYSPNATTSVKRGTTSDNYSTAMNQVAAAFQNAMMWRITGETKYAECAKNILNAWARTCTSIEGDTNASLAAGIYGYEFAQAGELLRGYSGWSTTDFKAYQDWMRNLWYPRAMYFLVNRHGRTYDGDYGNQAGAYFSNWGLCNVLAVMSIGILCDDVAIYNQGLSFYKDDKCNLFDNDAPTDVIMANQRGNNEFLGNLVIWLHPDSRGPFGFLGQMQESGRDQGHATMAAGLAADICQTAWNQGDDLYEYMNNRIAAGFEYIALVNSLNSADEVVDSVPFKPYNRTGMPTENYTSTQNGLTGWGAQRPYWDRILSHYEGIKGIKMTYSRKMRDKVGVDGGGGHYGSNSGGFDHLGFSTLTNYLPNSMYPAPGYYPLTLGTQIIYDGKTINDNRVNRVTQGASVTLIPTLPEGTTDSGNWRWETGETSREITFDAQRSNIYRVTYTASNGAKSVQAFNVAVSGDCTPDIITPSIKVGDVTSYDTIVTVLPFQSFTMSISTSMYSRGNAVWSTGNTGFSLQLKNGITNDSVFFVDHYNEGGYKTRINYHIKVNYITPSVAIDGGNAEAVSSVNVTAGQNVELKPLTTLGFDWGSFRWSTGHLSKNLYVLNIHQAKHLQVYYTLTKGDVTTIDTLDFNISVVRNNYQLANGDYYIQRASDKDYFTNPNATASTKDRPFFSAKNDADLSSQIWTITKETASDGGGRFKIVSKKDGNYVNEKGTFGTNPYYPAWNTYTLHCLDGENLFAVQNGGSSGTKFWTISGNNIIEGTTTQDGYPFLITPVDGQIPSETIVPGEGVISYIAPTYSVSGAKNQLGSTISIVPGKNLDLRPTKVTGLPNSGSWLWSDNSTGSTLDLGNVTNGGEYSVEFTYPEGDTTYVFPLTYTVSLSEDNYMLPAGYYRILRASDNTYLTNDGTLNPYFTTYTDDNDLAKIWSIALDATSSRHKIVSRMDNRFLDEHGRFNNNPYDAAWNTYLFHYTDKGEKIFAIQNAGQSGSTYWVVESNNMINDRNYTNREYLYKFEFVEPFSGIESINSSQAKIYYNANEKSLIVNLTKESTANPTITIFSVTGVKVIEQTCPLSVNNISMAEMSEGLYLGILRTGNKEYAFKFIKK